MRIRWTHPGPDLFEAVRSQDRARSDQERDARARERDRRSKARRHGGEPFDLNKRRLAEIVALIEHRHGGAADTDDADIYFRAALPHVLAAAGGPGSPLYVERALRWRTNCTPRIPDVEAQQMICEAERDAVEHRRSFLRADAMSKLLGVTSAERGFLGIVTIGAVDITKRERSQDRRYKARERARQWREAKRAADGKSARQETVSAEAKKAGVARSTIYRRRQRATLSYATSEDTYEADATLSYALDRRSPLAFADVAPSEKRSSAGPARPASASRGVGADGHSPSAQMIEVASRRSGEARLSDGGRDDPRDMIGGLTHAGAELSVYARAGGIMPESVRRATIEAKRLRHMRQEDVARAIGISRPQLANALQGRFGLSREAAAGLRSWLDR